MNMHISYNEITFGILPSIRNFTQRSLHHDANHLKENLCKICQAWHIMPRKVRTSAAAMVVSSALRKQKVITACKQGGGVITSCRKRGRLRLCLRLRYGAHPDP